ncbi:hypothetical protein ACJMK2_043512 [Sinanodonta woodiana]|uniref:C2 domain-containing protein n=1 Tax=Sinanodonta woodiana TaxID=1069815 RepID=A0ABD3VX54_SINWO
MVAVILVLIFSIFIYLRKRHVAKQKLDQAARELLATIRTHKLYKAVLAPTQHGESHKTEWVAARYHNLNSVPTYPQKQNNSDFDNRRELKATTSKDCRRHSALSELTDYIHSRRQLSVSAVTELRNTSKETDSESISISRSNLKKQNNNAELMRSLSSTDAEQSLNKHEDKEPDIVLTMKHDNAENTLRVRVISISGIAHKSEESHVFFNLILLPSKSGNCKSELYKISDTTTIDEDFILPNISQEDIDKSVLKITVFVKNNLKKPKDVTFGDAYVQCCGSTMDCITPVSCKVLTSTRRWRRKSTSFKLMLQELGSLLVLLEYQPQGKRIKVLLRKAFNIPRSDRKIGQPGHYVIINLLYDNKVIESKLTRPIAGYNPIWNQPYLFTVNKDNMTGYSMEFILMRERIYTKDSVIGHVILGDESSPTEQRHWQLSKTVETEMWHNIIPVLTY